jgi:UTP--glucose-1-phosphate uridylyltransferase
MKVRKAVIPAGGYGIRMFPASKAVRKELLPLIDADGSAKPAIHMIVEEATCSGIEEVCIVAQPDDVPLFERYFKRRLSAEQERRIRASESASSQYDALLELSGRISFAVQETPEGYGHAVYCARQFVGNEPFLLLLGDHLHLSRSGERCARQLLSVFESTGVSTSSVSLTHESQLHQFGAIAGTKLSSNPSIYTVSEIIEKPLVEYAREHLHIEGVPEGFYLCWFGQHAFAPDIFDAIEYHIRNNIREHNEIQLTNAQDLLRRTNGIYYAVVADGVRCDFGVPEGFARTIQILLERAKRA